jgi:hypothetical protein
MTWSLTGRKQERGRGQIPLCQLSAHQWLSDLPLALASYGSTKTHWCYHGGHVSNMCVFAGHLLSNYNNQCLILFRIFNTLCAC